MGLSRARLYYEPRRESAENLRLMRLLDEQYTRTPYYGIRRMTAWLRTQGYQANHKRIQRLLRLMGLEAIHQKPRLSQVVGVQQVWIDLSRGVNIGHVNQVWSTDITYIRLRHGFVYLVAILDWFSRYVVAWEASVTLDSNFCISALERALVHAQPEIFNRADSSRFLTEGGAFPLCDKSPGASGSHLILELAFLSEQLPLTQSSLSATILPNNHSVLLL